jgi:hypothetical protein
MTARRSCASGSLSASNISTPMRRIRSTCCARAASGQPAAAPPRSVMNSRRFTAQCLPCFQPKGSHTSVRQEVLHRGISIRPMTAVGEMKGVLSGRRRDRVAVGAAGRIGPFGASAARPSR